MDKAGNPVMDSVLHVGGEMSMTIHFPTLMTPKLCSKLLSQPCNFTEHWSFVLDLSG